MIDYVAESEEMTETFLTQVHFSVMARVAMQLGRESISSSIIAITELVKNSYDADAERVSIRFNGLDSDTPILVIEDNGIGMSRVQLEHQWLVIGTPNKMLSGRSKNKGRILTGEKGLGRLGLDRLCTQTVIQTFIASEEQAVKLVIDWTKYEEVSERLEEIKHDLYLVSKTILDPISSQLRQVPNGTLLVLSGLKDSWSQESIGKLREELTLLVSPFAGIGDFKINLDAGLDWDNVNGEIGSDTMLDAAEWKLTATLDDKGMVEFRMSSGQFEEVFTFGPEPWSDVFKNHRSNIPQCGPLSFYMYFYPRRPVSIGHLNLTLPQITKFLDANNGVRIYRDDFRVKPYGAPDGSGDWLRLSYRRQQSPQGVTQSPLGGWKVGYNQIVGAVFISREKNDNLIDQTNRENLVEGPAFSDMRMFVDRAVQFFEVKRQEFEIARKNAEASIYEKAKEEVERSSTEAEDVVGQAKHLVASIIHSTDDGSTPPLDLVDSLGETLSKIENQLQQVRKAQKEYEKQADEQQALLQRQKDTLGNLASLGILATSFGHETVGASNLVLTNARDLFEDMNAGLFMVEPDIRQDVEDELTIILHESEKIETFAKFMLRNVRRDARNRRSVRLDLVIDRVFQYFARLLEEKRVRVELEIQREVSPILAFEIDWESIFVNLITNSVWALENIAADRKVIRVIVRENEQKIHVVFGDSGKGLDSGIENQIFLPTISTKRNEQGEIIGTGMGLAIVKDFVESHDGGTITVEPLCDLGGAQFHISVRVPELQQRGKRQNNNV